MNVKVDLHTHTLASDGELTPTELVERAASQGVSCLAITDHDTCAGIEEAQIAADAQGITLVSGIELSTLWSGVGIHVVGLNIDPSSPVMKQAIQQQSEARVQRAAQIGQKLAKLNMPGVYEQAEQIAGRADVGRPHFARAMVKMGYVKTDQEAFSTYLGSGKAGDIKAQWPSIETAIDWIKQAGGVSVIAHPGKYKMTWAKLRRFCSEFKQAGGDGMEISYGGENPDRLLELSRIATNAGLKASVGSDFHSPRFHWTEVGKYPAAKGQCEPVWNEWV